METRFLLPSKRMYLRQGKGAGREACGEEVEMLARWEQRGVTGSVLALQPFLEGVQPIAGDFTHWR